jgi:tRNA1(Val) A37 N6-methylase TrmN6
MTVPKPMVLATSVDAFLGGRFAAIQPVSGHHRAGLDAVLLASAVEDAFRGTLIDLGAGTGAAGFAVAARCGGARVVLVERDETASLCASAALALSENRTFAGRVEAVTADIFDRAARGTSGLGAGTADAVIMNPPFHDAAAGTPPPSPVRRAAYVRETGLAAWFGAAASLLKPRGFLAVIFRADGLDALLAALGGEFGAIAIVPVAPRANRAATRVIVSMRKGSRSPLRLLAPLTLHGATGSAYLPAADAILRNGAALSAVHASWTGIG